MVSGFFHQDLHIFSGSGKCQKALPSFHQLRKKVRCNIYNRFFSVGDAIFIQFLFWLDQAIDPLWYSCTASGDIDKRSSADLFRKFQGIGNGGGTA